MKKGIFAILAMLTVFAMVMVSCGGGDSGGSGPDFYVTFNANGGTFSNGKDTKKVGVNKNKTVVAPDNPTKATDEEADIAYAFLAWHTEATEQNSETKFDFLDVINKDITLYAEWKEYDPSKILITLNGNGGTVIPASLVVDPNAPLTELDSVEGKRVGYELSGWSIRASGGTVDDVVTSSLGFSANTIIYAQWTASSAPTNVTVTFKKDAADSGAYATKTVAAGGTLATVDFPTDPSKDGYVFKGWRQNTASGAVFNSTTTVNGNLTVVAKWAQLANVTFTYFDETTRQIAVELGETTWAQVVGQLRRPKDTYTDDSKTFKAWKDASGKLWTTNGDVIESPISLTADWYSTVTTGSTTGATKVYLEDNAYVMFEFDISEVDGTDLKAKLNTLKTIKADYLASEAGVANNNGPYRVMGPYFFNGNEPIVQTYGDNSDKTRNLYGDFVIDANGAFATRWDGNASLPGTFNKFHSYLCVPDASGTPLTADTWGTFTYTFNYADDELDVGVGDYSYGKTLRFLDGVLTDGKDGDVTVLLPASTDFTKVYFAIGVTRRWVGNSSGSDGTQSPYEHGTVSYVKNVKLIWGDDSKEITGAIPSLTAQVPTGPAAASDDAITEITTSNQVFAGYVNPQIYSWSGAADNPIVIPADPNYTPPDPAVPATAALNIITADDPVKNETALVGNYQLAHLIDLSEYFVGDLSTMTLGSYWKFTIRANFYNEDNEQITTANSLGQVKFNADGGTSGIGGTIYNLGTSSTINVAIPALAAASSAVKYIRIENSSDTVKYIEITELTLLP